MKILGIDTSAAYCSVCVYDCTAEKRLSFLSEDIGKGHAEKLVPMIADSLHEASLQFCDIEKISVATGPGSFAGLRVGIAAARGLALSLGVPVVGPGSLNALADTARQDGYGGPLVSTIRCRENECYFQLSLASDKHPSSSGIAGHGELAELALANNAAVCGAGALACASEAGGQIQVIHELNAPDVVSVARLGATMHEAGGCPEPRYFRPPDAKPQAGFVLPWAPGEQG